MLTVLAWLILAVALGGCFGLLRRRALSVYWARGCSGRAWRRTFPAASKAELREYLQLFAQAFDLPPERSLCFAPTDRVTDVYLACNPIRGMPDALETELFVQALEERYGVTLALPMHENVSLGELFSLTRHAVA